MRTALDFHKYCFTCKCSDISYLLLFFENSQSQQYNVFLSAKMSLVCHPLPFNILLFVKQTKMSMTLPDIMVNHVIQVLCCGLSWVFLGGSMKANELDFVFSLLTKDVSMWLCLAENEHFSE